MQADRFPPLGHGGGYLAVAEQGNGEVIVQLRVVRLDLQCFPSVVDRALDLTFFQKSEGKIVLGTGVLWLELDGCFELGNRLIELGTQVEI